MSAPYPWQASRWRGLVERHAAGSLPHALLLHGPPGTGKTAFAHRFAQALLCREPPAEAPCGACEECRHAAAGTHPDRFSVSPPEEHRTIRIDQVRELGERLGLTAARGGAKAAVLAPAESMTPAAANSLLKTLEEPPPGTCLLLVSHAPSQLLATVRSRCQALAFPPVSGAEAGAWLRAELAQAHDPELLLAMVSGRPLAAVALASGGGLAPRDRILADLEALLAGRKGPAALAQGWVELGVGPAVYWNALLAQDLLRSRSGIGPGALRCRDLGARLETLSKRVTGPLLLEVYDQCLAVWDVLARQLNLTPASLLERIALGWVGMTPTLTPWR